MAATHGIPALAVGALATGAAISDPADHVQLVHEGWLLKKGRRKLQGFARRYFRLSQGGMLSYSFQPDAPVRDQIPLRMRSFITSSVSRREIHIDGTHVTFHIRALTQDDFEQWMAALRKFVIVRQGPDTLKKLSMPRSHSFPLATLTNKSITICSDMDHSLAQLEEVFKAFRDEDSQSSRPSVIKTKKEAKDNGNHGLFGMFQRKSQLQPPTPPESTPSETTTGTGSIFQPSTLERFHAVVETLRAQHVALTDAINMLANTDFAPSSATRLPSMLSTHHEIAEEPLLYSPVMHPRRASMAPSRMSTSDGGSVWFDAEDGAEELILDEDPDETGPIIVDDAESEDSVEAAFPSEHHVEEEQVEATPEPTPPPVVRRTRLPAPASTEEPSMIGVFRKNIGKDLTAISMPVLFNEPISVLQRLDEDLEYSDLLPQAVAAIDPVERMAFVAALMVSGYASTQYRATRKPFNPMLGETYEDDRVCLIAEKVSHQPPIMACHADGDGWEYWATFGSKSKFWGKSYEITPVGTTHLRIGEDHYTWQRPSTYMRNLMGGQRYLEHTGPVTITNRTSGMACQLEFKETPFFGGSPNVVAGTITNARGRTEARLEGKWSESLALVTGPQSLRMLWRAAPFPPDALEYYGFTAHTVTLNEITPDIEHKLPPTDSRRRPDQSALEEGDFVTAEEEKHRIEDLQRDRRKRGADARPQWFKQSGDEWVYAGGYWEEREKGWQNPVRLW